MFGILSSLFGPKVDFKDLVQKGAIIIDVRTPGEYSSGHIKGSKNIPLDRIASEAGKLQKENKVIITVCRSGARSGMAASTLKGKGIEVYNGGPWDSLQAKI